jgi:hypothetical protein
MHMAIRRLLSDILNSGRMNTREGWVKHSESGAEQPPPDRTKTEYPQPTRALEMTAAEYQSKLFLIFPRGRHMDLLFRVME